MPTEMFNGELHLPAGIGRSDRLKKVKFEQMKIKLKYIVLLVTVAAISSIIYGFSIKEEDPNAGNKFIGAGTVGLFLVAMPLFLMKESKGKNMKDYMLNKENIKKMQENEQKWG